MAIRVSLRSPAIEEPVAGQPLGTTGGDLRRRRYEANWDALLRTMALFRLVAVEVAAHLGYTYPLAMDEGVTAYVERVRRLDRQ
jgi:hypothetical protein